jgi:integrase
MSSYETRQNSSGDISYRVRFRLNKVNRAKTFTTQEAAATWKSLLDAVGAVRALEVSSAPAPTNMRTVTAQVTNHIEHLTGVTDGTRARYQDYLRRRIEPHPIGSTALSFLNRDAVAAWVNWMAREGLSAKTIKNHHSLLSASLTSAVRDQLIPTNYAEGIRIATPTDEGDEMVTLTLVELWEFINAAPGHWRPMVMFLFGTGVRFGEASALQVSDVDLDAGLARIRRAWKHTNGHGHQMGRPKSARSLRTIVFGRDVADAIRPLMEARGATAFLFTNTRGGPVRRTNFAEQAWEKALHVFAGDVPTKVPTAGRPRVEWELGLGKRPTPHDARHTYASLQILRGASDAFLQRQLGHESITTTINLYTHLRTEDLRVLADVIDFVPLELHP